MQSPSQSVCQHLDTPTDGGLATRRGLELFAGIGGFACAAAGLEIVAAVDINQVAAAVYRRNFSHPYLVRDIQSLSNSVLAGFEADLWWLSPPCQPFSRRGAGRDIDDPRTAGLLRVIQAIGFCRPQVVGLENVVGFDGSRAHALLMEQFGRQAYHVQCCTLCPTELNWPNRRPRFYMLASRSPMISWQPLPHYSVRWSDLLEPVLSRGSLAVNELMLAADDVRRYQLALDRIETSEPARPTACFAGSYGKTLLQAGSYLRCGSGYRRFSPREVARLLGFPERFDLNGLSPRAAWRLLGNSLSLPVVRYVLSHLPGTASIAGLPGV